MEEPEGPLVPGDGAQVGLRFVRGRTDKTKERLHLHLTSESLDDQRRTVAKVLRLGGRHIALGQQPEGGHVVLADPEGNELCVIEPGNSYLAGCGFLGEVACDGSRDVGLFWSKAMAWPLVWDQNEETAIQSPNGGTKIAWGGPPVDPKTGRSRQRFELRADAGDFAAEIERLVSLGASGSTAAERARSSSPTRMATNSACERTDAIAARVGLGSAVNVRRRFRARVGTEPPAGLPSGIRL